MENTDQQVGQILQALRAAAPRLTESVVQTVFWSGVINAILCIIGIGIALFFAFHGYRWGKKAATDNDWGDPSPLFAAGLTWLMAILIGAISLTSIGDAVLRIASPQGIAVAHLLHISP